MEGFDGLRECKELEAANEFGVEDGPGGEEEWARPGENVGSRVDQKEGGVWADGGEGGVAQLESGELGSGRWSSEMEKEEEKNL